MGENVIGGDKIPRPSLRSELLRIGTAEELDACFDPLVTCSQCNTFTGLDAQTNDSLIDRVLQKISIVRRNLEMARRRAQLEALSHVINICSRMLQP